MRTTTMLALMCSVLLLLAGCPQPSGENQEATPGVAADRTTADDATAKPAVDQILASLADEQPDVRNFALLAIVNFDLKGYRERLLELAADDPVAAITVAAVNGEIQPASDFYITGPQIVRTETILGTVFGLECANRIPAALWTDILSRAPEAEVDPLLWGLAQLEVEPGGPVQRSAEFTAALENRYVEALANGAVYRLGALDALLGTTGGRVIDWQRYIDHVPASNWNNVQWSALLRWADTETWHKVITLKGVNDRIRYQLVRALAINGPAEVALPGGLGPWAGIDADIEFRVNQFTRGKSAEIEMPELDVLLEEIDALTDAGSTDIYADLNQRVLSDVMAILDYSLIHNRQANISRIVEALELLPPRLRTTVMAEFMRRNPQALTDEHLVRIIALNDREVAYFLLSGWFDRQVVRDSEVPELVRTFPGSGNLIVAFAYQQWLEESGAGEPQAER